MRRLRIILGLAVVALAISAAVVAPAFGSEECPSCTPWWHLAAAARPTYLKAGESVDAVQDLTINATGGDVLVTVNGQHAAFPYNASRAAVQAALESVSGPGSVEVSGANPFTVSFKGELGARPIAPIAEEESSQQACVFFPTDTCLEGSANATEAIAGKADGEIAVTAANLGDETTQGNVNVVDELPPGLRAVSIDEVISSRQNHEGLNCKIESPHLTGCTLERELLPYARLEFVIGVDVETGAAAAESTEVKISGGGAPSTSASRPITISDLPVPAGVQDYELTPEEAGGARDTQAGSHPFQLTASVTLNQLAGGVGPSGFDQSGQYEAHPAGLPKDLSFRLPAGLIGNPTPIEQCPLKQFFAELCPPQSVIGVSVSTFTEPESLGLRTQTVPLFNLEPVPGEPARFAFYTYHVPTFLDTSVRSGGDYGVTVSVANVPETIDFIGNTLTIWGVPGDPRHDQFRGWECLRAGSSNGRPCQLLDEPDPPAFLSLPTSCATPIQSAGETDAWSSPGAFQAFATDPSSTTVLDGCNRLPFSPEIKVTPDGQEASRPTGLTVDVHVPQQGSINGSGLANSNIKNIAVTLPEGVTLNPAAADGLLGCAEAQVGFMGSDPSSGAVLFTPTLAAPFCPDAAKVASVKIKSPLLPPGQPLVGAVYLATPAPGGEAGQNPFASLVAMYIVAEDPISGTVVKLPGKVTLDPATGQIRATFENAPQLAFEDAEIHFFGGSRAPLATPARCGTYTTSATFTPWSGNEAVSSTSSFQVTSGPNGSSCPGASLPFAPSLAAGTTNINAGSFTPLTTTIGREDGNQSIQTVQLHMPAGLSGVLAGVKLCGEAQANAGTCGAESLIGHTIVSVGLGDDPFSVTGGQVFLTERYEGAPFGLSIVNPAVAGPFDLGKVIVRAKVEVDPTTAALTITTGAIPHILDGIPLEIKHVQVAIDRAGFTFNPTNCRSSAITGSIGSVEGGSAPVSVPFQVTNCASLKFAPKLAASSSARTSRAGGASLSVKLTYPKAPQGSQANIARVKVDLPKQLPSRLTTLQKACTAAQFNANPAGCPAASIVGHAKATTPILPVALEGPAYFVSHGGEAFPSLIVVLQGYGVTVDLVGTTFIAKTGITSSTFKSVPDVPVGSFELSLPEGKYSALAANGNLCASKLAMPTAFVAQNGAEIHGSTNVAVTGCAKAKKATRAQKLAAALKACQKKAQGKRAACEGTARRQYGSAKKTSKKK
jgi:hypothetical protein